MQSDALEPETFPIQTKACTLCKEIKPLAEFGPQKKMRDGRKSACRVCLRGVNRSAAEKFREENPELVRYKSLKKEAPRRGAIFTLTFEDYCELVSVTHCPCCNTPFPSLRESTKKNMRSIRSIDRLVPAFGYTKENCVVLCYKCNCIKQDAPPEDILLVAYWASAEIIKRGLVSP